MRYIGFIFALCLSIQAIASNTLSISSVSGTPQTEVEVVVSLDNTDAITALEMVLPLGEYLSYVTNSAVLSTARSNGHMLSAAQVRQELRIYVYSFSQNALSGNTGELLTFRLLLGNEPADYALTPTVVLSDAQGTSIAGSIQAGNVTIQAPKLQIVNPQIDYGHIPIREAYTQELFLENVGNLPLVIEDITITDPLLMPLQTALTIEAGQTASVSIEYAPVVSGAISKEVLVKSNAINGDQVATILADPFSVNELHVGSASGIADSIVTISLTMNNMEPIVAMQCAFVLPEQLEYVANSLQPNAVRTNGHQVLSTLRSDTLFLAIFSMSNQPLHANDGEIATFQIRLNGNSGSYGLYPQDVVLSNITEENMVSATYEGWVTIQSPQLYGDDYLSFGDCPITDTAIATYSFNNYGDAPLRIERVTFFAEGYHVVTPLPLVVNPWEEGSLQIACNPKSEGDFSTTMNLYTNDPTNRLKAIALSGHVYEPNSLTIEGMETSDGKYQLAISLNNYTDIVALQYDIHWRSDMTTSQAAFTPTARLQNHSYSIVRMDVDTYRVLIYSLVNSPIIGSSGELHQLIFTPQGEANYCDNVITIDNIVLSNSNGTDKVSESTISYYTPSTQYVEEMQTAYNQYIWHNRIYNESGTYIDTLQTITGCDSIVTLHLTINIYIEENVIACDSYTWHGETYTESGDYEYRTTLENGCERVEILHLSINKSEREEYTATACDQYEWNGQVYTESGDYEYRTTTDAGCERVEVLHLTINRSEREDFYDTACDEYYWWRDGNVYYESGTYEHHTTTIDGCERVEVLHLTINRSEREEYWETACDNYEWYGQVYTESGDYEFRTTTDQGCEHIEILRLTIYHSEYEEYTVTACDEYWWHDNLYTESGDYTYTRPILDWGTGYCERTEVLHLTINKRDTVHYYETACDSYYWSNNGNEFYHSGDYEHYTTNELGCERVEVLHLTINRSEREEYWETACDQYEWHGQVYTDSGDYEYRTTTADGCERVEVLHLTIYHSEYEEYSITACDKFWWHDGHQYTESGDYTYSYVIADWGTGYCERTEVLHLTITRDTVHYYETACDRYYWSNNGNEFYDSGVYEHHTTNELGCERVEILHLSINKSEREEYTATACDQYEWNGQVYTESGDYEYRTTTEQGCEHVEVLHLAINRSEREEYEVTACDQYEWHGELYTESGDYEYRTNNTETEKLYVGYNSQHDPIIGLTPPRGISRFIVDGFITNGSGSCFVGTGSPENGIVDDEGDLRIFDAGCFYYDRMSGRNGCFFDDFRYPFNIEFGNYYAKNLETGAYYFDEGNNVYEYSNTEYPLTLFYKDYGKIHKVQFFDNNNLLWADINAVLEDGVPMIKIDYYETNGTIYHSQKFTENLHAETKTISSCGRVEILHLTINNTQYAEETVTACDNYTWNGETYTESGEYVYNTVAANGCDSIVTLHLTINATKYAEEIITACDSYVWNGETYTESGEYTYTTTASNRCDSIITLHLTINQTQIAEESVVACDSYVWNGVTYTESGYYTYTTTTEQGCERVEVLHLTILPEATTESGELALCPSELPYEWYGQSLTEEGTYSATEQYAGMECDSIIHELTLNVYVQTLPATVTLPIVRTGEAIDVTTPTAEIQAHIAAETWYAPNAEVAWYIMDNSDWAALSADPVAVGITEVTLKYVVDTDCGNVESDKMVINLKTTDMENTQSQSPTSNCQKILYEDHIYILREGKIYNAMGQEIGN